MFGELTNELALEDWKFQGDQLNIYKNQKRASTMIFITFFIVYTCFPALVVYKPMPGSYFKYLLGNPDTDDHENWHQINAVAWCGVINVGSFLIF